MNSIFGQNCSYEKARLALLGVPWEATVSYGCGTAQGPQWIQKASSQLDFFNPKTGQNASKMGICFLFMKPLAVQSGKLRKQVSKITQTKTRNPKNYAGQLQKINQACLEMTQAVRLKTKNILEDGKLFGMLGGDHSVSEGALIEMGRRYQKGGFGLLHLDAHADMRRAYQGFKHSHASVMFNVLQQKNSPQTIVQAGIRDLSEDEYQIISSDSRVHCFFDHEIKKQLFEGKTWGFITRQIIEKLPDKIYISLDVDALPWAYAPHTGCPVPGGLDFDQISYLFEQIAAAKKQIIGFDIVETAPPKLKNFGEWDGNVSARLAYKLCELSLFQEPL